MTTFTSPLETYRFIDTAPLEARFEVLMATMFALIDAGQMGRVLKTSQAVAKLVRAFCKFDAQNVLLRRKLALLSNPSWCIRVLKDLGGVKKLVAWEAAAARRRAGLKPKPRLNDDFTPAWMFTPERIAESERLKAHKRKCARAAVNPHIFRDRVQMDFDGFFRLPPLPRGNRIKRPIKVYTQETISSYDWNPLPFAKIEDFGPATVWPVEFYTAITMDSETTAPHLSCHSEAQIASERPHNDVPDATSRSNLSTFRAPPEGSEKTESKPSADNDKNETLEDGQPEKGRPLIPLHMALPEKTWRAIFETPI